MSEQMAIARRHAHVDDVRWLRSWAADHPSGRVMQLGAGSGTMAVALWEGSQKIRMCTVDSERQNLAWEQAALENMGAVVSFGANRGAFCRHIHSDSVKVARSNPWGDDSEGSPVGLLIIDTAHDYETTKAELEAWLPTFGHETLVLLHDYDPVEPAPQVYAGVKRAADEVLEGLGWSIIDQIGWSAILKEGFAKPKAERKRAKRSLKTRSIKELRAVAEAHGIPIKSIANRSRILRLLKDAGITTLRQAGLE